MDTQKNLDRINIILVNPQEAANIGSVCRAMKTMGISKLTIVSDKIYEEKRVATLAVHAYDIYENSKKVGNLKEAIKESVLVIATSRRRGKFRKYFSIVPQQLAEIINKTGSGIVSIVFGSESSGLTAEELQLCHTVLRIPTSDIFPSLNLAQAVQIVTYTLFSSLTPIVGFEPVTEKRLEKLSSNIGISLKNISFYRDDEQNQVERFFHDIFARSALSEKEAQQIEKIFLKIEKLKIHRRVL
ncbi:MAG: TrmJ/YjtD family RNA methyltransferase [Sphaerochaetaceae bacterium]|jgi:tRNA/rRNA methyltransferase